MPGSRRQFSRKDMPLQTLSVPVTSAQTLVCFQNTWSPAAFIKGRISYCKVDYRLWALQQPQTWIKKRIIKKFEIAEQSCTPNNNNWKHWRLPGGQTLLSGEFAHMKGSNEVKRNFPINKSRKCFHRGQWVCLVRAWRRNESSTIFHCFLFSSTVHHSGVS